jgi:type VI secretion system protein ImpH
MVRTDGNETSNLKQELLSHGSRFSFVQVRRLLDLLTHRGSLAEEEEQRDRIKVCPDLSLSFPENDVVSISQTGQDPDTYSVVTTFLGLYGSSSPLPTFYTEDLLREAADDVTITRDFIDIINAPVYDLFFRCWAKYRLYYQLVESADPGALERLFCLIGIGSESIKQCFPDAYSLLRYTGIVTQMPRSAEGLRCILSDFLNEPSIRIEQCILKDVEIPGDQRAILGVQAHCLGEDSSLGSQVSDCKGQFRIHAGPLTAAVFQRMLPNQPSFQKVKELIWFYLDQPLSWDMELVVRPDEIRPACLGAVESSCLGYNCWLPSEDAIEECTVRFQPAA